MDPNAGSIIAVAEALVHMIHTALLFWMKIFLFHCGLSHFGHSQSQGIPEVVTPLKITGTGGSMRPPGWTSYSLHFGGQTHILHMKVNKNLLARHMPVFTYTDQGALLEDQPFVQSDCFYHGYVEGDPESLVALSSCFGGFRGMLQIHDIAYEIKPRNRSSTFEHLVYRMEREDTSPPLRCGLTDEEIEWQLKSLESDNSTLMQSGYEGWWTHRRYLELAVVVDHNRYLHSNSNISSVYADVCTVLNGIDFFLKSVDVEVILTGIEVWTNQNAMVLPSDISPMLTNFCTWKKTSFANRVPHDIVHLFVKMYFQGVLGLAFIASICNDDYNCGVDSFMNDKLQEFAFIVSHELGHNMGMYHDNNLCTCGDIDCIMMPSRSDATKFSNCSYSSFWTLTTDEGKCFFSPPKHDQLFKYPRCGNHVTEPQEECDCGSLKLCAKDPCCQSNCTLRPGANCASGLCCKDCKILPAGTVCRAAENICDLSEWCNGTSYLCPEDVYVQGGTPCPGGYCYEKRCNNRDEQCGKIFGNGAKNANDRCYQEMNTRGDRFGHCGLDEHTYVRCKAKDILCGRVQCVNVDKIPLLSNHSTVHWTSLDGIACWGTDFHFGMTIPDIGEVKDGTECGAEHICIERKCVPMSDLTSPCSSEFCKMNGVCNNKDHCHCNFGWSPPNCEHPGLGGSVDSGPAPQITNTFMKQFWLLRLVLFLIVALISTGLKYCETRKLMKEAEDEEMKKTHETIKINDTKGITETNKRKETKDTRETKLTKHIEIIDTKESNQPKVKEKSSVAPKIEKPASMNQKVLQTQKSQRQKSQKL
ncbi:disintegrin and metalloproteinase domain-containing protein 20-like [Erinaceus europaeus]|uniref:Disintegrin and metalloproteinase domain-containing protein 20-like n=1 Tax=Erinaceus europaeus TaxID=9365 RepID=A0A1S3A2L7_ERIEU|nr:disintegrin and metalloproteinase domain-containing protein 20-like [Erinaceus europaeus]